MQAAFSLPVNVPSSGGSSIWLKRSDLLTWGVGHCILPDQGAPTLDEYLVSIHPQDRLSTARTMTANAEDSKDGKWSVYGEWSNGVRKYSRAEEGFSVGSEWLSRDPGLKRPNPCESGRYQLSGAVGITFKNCPAYIREWIMSQKSSLAKPVGVRRNDSDNRKIR
jgi:hypothetical protein